jgi:hypothetical protein
MPQHGSRSEPVESANAGSLIVGVIADCFQAECAKTISSGFLVNGWRILFAGRRSHFGRDQQAADG